MKLISTELRVDNDTLQPMIRVTLDMPLEPIVDQEALEGEDELHRMMGEKLCKAMQGQGLMLDLITEAWAVAAGQAWQGDPR